MSDLLPGTEPTTDPATTRVTGGDPDQGGPLIGAADPLRSFPATLLAVATAWVSLLAWRPMAEDPGRITRPLILAALIVSVVGWVVRRGTGRAWTAVPVQLVVLLVWLVHDLTGSWLPTGPAVSTLVDEVRDGILASQRYYSPVSVEHPEYHFLLTVGGVGILLAVDLLVCGARQPALAGLPLLLVITVAASILVQPLGVGVFAGTALGWLALLVVRESGRLDAWSVRPRLADLAPVAAGIAVLSVLVAVVLTGGVTAQGRIFQSGGDDEGSGPGSALNVNNPLLDMRRNLRQEGDVPLVRVRTSSTPSYLRLTVLDDFTGSSWAPSDRSTGDTEPITGTLPTPLGVSATDATTTQTWRISVLSTFGSTWLPLPTPTTSLDVDSRWRYDPSTLDVLASRGSAAGMDYSAGTFTPKVDPAAARTAGAPPDDIDASSTTLPSDLPRVFRQTAQRVAREAGATNDFDRAVALQNWFRSTGGFTYSTEPAPGNGIDTLTRFITTDRVGYCEQFSAAMAVMARSLGIPARVSVGFLEPEQTGAGTYTFSSRDLHAWPELYFTGVGWTRFEPTPGTRTGTPPAYTDGEQTPAAPSSAPTQQASPAPQQATPTPQGTDRSGSQRSGGVAWRPVVLVALGLLVLGALVVLPGRVRRTLRRRRWNAAEQPREIADTAWAEVRETARALDLEWSETSSVRVNGARVGATVPQDSAREALDEVVRYVELTRYARPGTTPDTAAARERMRADVARWRAAAYDAADPRTTRRARLRFWRR